ncbi:MAG: ribosome silencing factor [Bacteroidales bacterium]|nr:ribosome silencing factor [Candidatus Liminaster caballi]
MNDQLLNTIIDGLQNGKAHDIQVIDMSKLEEAAFSYFIICEGSSSTQVYGIANGLTRHVRETLGTHEEGSVGMNNRLWVAVDYGYVLVHIFQPETRQFYNLESLWEDAVITKIPDLD